MYSIKIDPKYNKYQNPKIGLIALASDYMIEKDFFNVIKGKKRVPLAKNVDPLKISISDAKDILKIKK